MFWSRNKFFHKSNEQLKIYRVKVKTLLSYKCIDNTKFIQAYDYFVFHPTEFDGATIVKDLDDLPDLDLSALVHDYDYIVELPKHIRLKWVLEKTKMDWQYAKNMEQLGKGITIPYSRALGLIITTPIYWAIKKIQKWRAR
jgi:hypothetical protein